MTIEEKTKWIKDNVGHTLWEVIDYISWLYDHYIIYSSSWDIEFWYYIEEFWEPTEDNPKWIEEKTVTYKTYTFSLLRDKFYWVKSDDLIKKVYSLLNQSDDLIKKVYSLLNHDGLT